MGKINQRMTPTKNSAEQGRVKRPGMSPDSTSQSAHIPWHLRAILQDWCQDRSFINLFYLQKDKKESDALGLVIYLNSSLLLSSFYFVSS